jgi:sporulation protein YlmC with PRC-barrel domain
MERKRAMTRLLSLAAAAALPLSQIAGASAAIAQKPVVMAVVDVKMVALGYRVSELIGRPVINEKGKKIGRIDDFIVQQDRVLMTIIRVGGFLGIGGRLVAVPYSSLFVSPAHIVLAGATDASVASMPEFTYR